MPTTAADAVQVIFNAPSVEEQEEVYARLTETRLLAWLVTRARRRA